MLTALVLQTVFPASTVAFAEEPKELLPMSYAVSQADECAMEHAGIHIEQEAHGDCAKEEACIVDFKLPVSEDLALSAPFVIDKTGSPSCIQWNDQPENVPYNAPISAGAALSWISTVVLRV